MWTWTCSSCGASATMRRYDDAGEDLTKHYLEAGHADAYMGNISGSDPRFNGLFVDEPVAHETDGPESHMAKRWERVQRRWSMKHKEIK